jgi:disulfide bond formation protein DsbB
VTDCVLPATGSDPLFVVLLALLVLGTGVALVLGVRRRGVSGAAIVVVALALGAATAVVSDARKAGAQECPPETTVASTAAPTTIAATTTAAATTTTVATTTTAASTTTTAAAGGAVPTPPTVATTTTVGVPDLMPSLAGPSSFRALSGAQTYTLTVTNLGTAQTNGPMSFTVTVPATGSVPIVFAVGTGWTAMTVLGDVDTPTTVTITSAPPFSIPAGGTSTLTLQVSWNTVGGGQFTIDVTLPPGIGGETNGANNTVTPPFVVNVIPFP